MAKKVSKHSRAARRGEIGANDLAPEAKLLAEVPRVHTTDLANSVIRKNQSLLDSKLKPKEGGIRKKTNTSRNKALRFATVDGRLSTKISQSIERSRVVQNTRKSGWDSINKALQAKPQEKPKAKPKVASVDAEVMEEFFEGEEKEEADGEGEVEVSVSSGNNAYALLMEEEA